MKHPTPSTPDSVRPSAEPDWKAFPIGTWFFYETPNCLYRYSVQERTDGGCSVVCSTPYIHEAAKRDMIEIAESHNAKLRAATPELSRWIAVNERLPEDGKMVVTFGSGLVNVETYPHNIGWLDDDGPSRYFEAPNVTHWMPLPAPPLSTE